MGSREYWKWSIRSRNRFRRKICRQHAPLKNLLFRASNETFSVTESIVYVTDETNFGLFRGFREERAVVRSAYVAASGMFGI